MIKSENPQIIEKEVIGKIIEDILIDSEFVTIKFTDGNFIDIDLNERDQKLTTRMNWY